MNIKTIGKFIGIGVAVANENEKMLCDLDSQNGDGDLGITFSKVMKSFQQTYENYKGTDIGKFFYQAGMDVTENAASTMGTLLASGFMQVGKSLRGKEELQLEDYALFYQAMVDGIQKRGKASIGDKTILDTLQPIAEFLKLSSNTSVTALFESAVTVAEEAVENTKILPAKHGRAARYKNKSVGLVDSGSVIALLITKVFNVTFKSSLEI